MHHKHREQSFLIFTPFFDDLSEKMQISKVSIYRMVDLREVNLRWGQKEAQGVC